MSVCLTVITLTRYCKVMRANEVDDIAVSCMVATSHARRGLHHIVHGHGAKEIYLVE